MRGEDNACTVELCGLPGAGKSFLAQSLAEHLAAHGVRVAQPLAAVAPTRPRGRRLVAKLWIAVRELAFAPLGSVRALAAIHRSGQPLRDVLHRSLNWLVVRGLYRRARRGPGVHVFEQGIVQELCSIGYEGDWRPCLAVAGPGGARLGPDVLISVAAPIETAARRVEVRPGMQSRIERLGPAARRGELGRQADALATIEKAWLERYGGILGTRRIEVRNDGERLTETLQTLTAAVI